MGSQSGDEELRAHRQHVPLLGAFQARLLQRLQRQTVPAGGRGAHYIRPGAGFVQGLPHGLASSPTWVLTLTLCFLFDVNVMTRPQIELRKRGVMPKETGVTNPAGTTDKDRDAAGARRDKRGGFRVSPGGSGDVISKHLSKRDPWTRDELVHGRF